MNLESRATENHAARRLLVGPLRLETFTAARGGNLIAPGWVDRRAAFSTDNLRRAERGNDDQAREDAARAFRQEHMFWKQQQILDRYGKPDGIYMNDQTVVWYYRMADPDQEKSFELVEFHFDDGMLVDAVYMLD